MRLAKGGRIILDFDEMAEVSHVTVQEADESDSEIELTEAPEASRKYFTMSLFDSAAVYTTSCSASDDDEINEELSVPPEENGDGNIKPQLRKKREWEDNFSPIGQAANVVTNPAVSVIRYIPKSRRKDGESPFAECTNPKGSTKVERKFDDASWHILKEKGVISIHKVSPSKLTKAPLSGFVVFSNGSFQDERHLPKMRTSDRFDPNAYKLSLIHI